MPPAKKKAKAAASKAAAKPAKGQQTLLSGGWVVPQGKTAGASPGSKAGAGGSSNSNSSPSQAPFVFSAPKPPKTPEGELQGLWELPWIAHFVWLFQQPLCMKSVEPASLEAALVSDRLGPMLAELLSKLLLPDTNLRRQLASDAFSVEDINSLLARYVASWLEGTGGEEDDAGAAGGSFNPLRSCLRGSGPWLEEIAGALTLPAPGGGRRSAAAAKPGFDFLKLTPITRCYLVHALCEARMQLGKEFAEHLRNLEPSTARIEPVGYDSNGCGYFNFGFGGFRIYRAVTKRSAPPVSPLRSASDPLLPAAEYQREYRRLYEEQLTMEQLEAAVAAYDRRESRAAAKQQSGSKRKQAEGDAEPASVGSADPFSAAAGGAAQPSAAGPRKRQKLTDEPASSSQESTKREKSDKNDKKDKSSADAGQQPEDDEQALRLASPALAAINLTAAASIPLDPEVVKKGPPELVDYLRMMGVPSEEVLRRVCALKKSGAAKAAAQSEAKADGEEEEDDEGDEGSEDSSDDSEEEEDSGDDDDAEEAEEQEAGAGEEAPNDEVAAHVRRFLQSSGTPRRLCPEPEAPEWQLMSRTRGDLEALLKALRRSPHRVDKGLAEALKVVLEAGIREEEEAEQRRQRIEQKAAAEAARLATPVRASSRLQRLQEERAMRQAVEDQMLIDRAELLRQQRDAQVRRLAASVLAMGDQALLEGSA